MEFNRVRSVRESKNMTLDELARRSGLAKSTVSAVERFKEMPSQLVCMKLAMALRMNTEEVFLIRWQEIESILHDM